MARELGVGEERAGLLPAEKVSAIAELDARHGPTGMVGDGVNDAPALAAAKVSIALGGISSGAALESADIVLLADDLNRLPWLIRHSRATLARIRQNITLALATKVSRLGPGHVRHGQSLDGGRRGCGNELDGRCQRPEIAMGGCRLTTQCCGSNQGCTNRSHQSGMEPTPSFLSGCSTSIHDNVRN